MAMPKTAQSIAQQLHQPTEVDHQPGDWEELIEADPNWPGPDHVVLKDTGIPVWAIVGYLQSLTGTDVDTSIAREAILRTAADYEIDETLVHAAISYYLD